MGMIIMNGKEYTSSPKDGFPPIIYSDEEREIGIWRDGKPLYERTFVSTSSSVGTPVTWDISDLNIDKVVKQSGSWCRQVISSSDKYWYDIDNVQSTDFAYLSKTLVSISENLLYSTIEMASGNTVLYRSITLQYTKTTDVPGSGKYTTYGRLTHHYSTTEQVVGTWIDGKPLYERTWDLGSDIDIGTSSWVALTAISNTGMNLIINAKTTTSNGIVRDVLYAPKLNENYVVAISARNGTESARYVTLQYTKTTD